MELKEFYKQAIEDRFKAHAAVVAIEKKIENLAKESIFDRYKDETIFKDDLEFELVSVRATISGWVGDLHIRKIDIALFYTCKSKLPKAKRERVEIEKKEVMETGHFGWSAYKTPLWHTFYYSLDIDKIILGNFNLLR